jgi:hypothetical protein
MDDLPESYPENGRSDAQQNFFQKITSLLSSKSGVKNQL